MIIIMWSFCHTNIEENVSIKEQNVSVIIPMRNEENNILQCLDSLLHQQYSFSAMELIIVDDHSSDTSIEKVKEFKNNYQELRIKIIQLKQNQTSKKKALTTGVDASSYNLIMTTDADCIVPKNWIKLAVSKFNKDAEMIIGPVMFNYRKGFLSAFQTLDFIALQGLTFGMIGINKPVINNAANLSYTKKGLKKAEGFDQHLTPSGDDVFLLEKFRRSELKIVGLLDRDYIVTTNSEISLKKFIQQRIRWSSKSKFYKNSDLVILGLFMLMMNLIMIFIYVALVLVENYTKEWLIFLSCKWMIDFILLFLVATFFKKKKALLYFIPVQLIYPFYTVFIWMYSLTGNFEWKGRKFNV